MSSVDDVMSIYSQWFQRTPSDAALRYWASLIDSGETRDRVQQMMLATPEGREVLKARVTEWYQSTFDRAPDSGGLAYWSQEALKGVTFDRLLTRFGEAAQPELDRLEAARIAGESAIPDPLPITTTPPEPATTVDLDAALADADYSTLKTVLNQYGLGDLYDTAVDLIASNASESEIELELRNTDAFKERFAVIFDREAAGKSPVSPEQVMSFEAGLEQLASYMGLPEDYGDVKDLTRQLMANDVSLNEASERLFTMRTFARQVLEDPNQDTEAVQAILDRGATLYDVANFALDPTRTLDQVQRRLEAAAVANEASQASYSLAPSEAMEQARLGMTAEQARQGFQALTAQSQIVNALGNGPDLVSREEELAYARGEVAGQQAVERARRTRVNDFAEGGGFASDRDGFSGLR